MMRERGMHLGWPELNRWISVSFLLKFQQAICHGFLIHCMMRIPPSSVWIMTIRRDCGGWLPAFTAQEVVGQREKMIFLRPHSWSLSKLGTEPRPVSLPTGPYLRPSPGPEHHISPSSPASSLSLCIWSWCFFCYQQMFPVAKYTF